MSFKKYRLIDLSIFFVFFAIFEFLILKCGLVWFTDEPWTVSLMLPLLLILIIRWDKFTFIHAVLYALYFCFLYALLSPDIVGIGSIASYASYLAGNLGFMLILIFVKKVSKEKITSSPWMLILYCLIGFVLMEGFRGVTAFLFDTSKVYLLYESCLYDVLSFAFAIVILLISRKVNGLLQDQKTYLLELEKEKEKEKEK